VPDEELPTVGDDLPSDGLPLSRFRPQPQLVLPDRTPTRPRFPVIDAHLHLGPRFGGGWSERPVEELLATMDEAGVEAVVDLDGGWGEGTFEGHYARFGCRHPGRFLHFGGVAWDAWQEQGDRFGEWAAGRLRSQVERGARGLKVWKPLGLHVRDQHGRRVPVHDERLDPLWSAAGELGVPVLIHVADPVAFFDALDERNERWEELHRRPEWRFPSPPFPPFRTILEEFAELVRRHRSTLFIGAHVGCYAENLAWVSALLDECPNLYVDISSRIAELGRQPYSSRRFFLRYPERILFGTDSRATPQVYRLYYRFLETDDEYFDYSVEPTPPQGRWRIYGLHLPDEVLERVYNANARELLRLGDA
jgi:predicted TIM-barrel fold metal-dependent hydrolase